ncbi:MAG: DoxX family protein [Gammaproteobacteria bacterium]|nr:DoxX family protein [Gammaproteobacteria bacterium]
MSTTVHSVATAIDALYRKIDLLAPLGNLALRLWVANVFFKSGMLKLGNWDSTMYLFENEYHVPILSPNLAALMGTGAELVLPVLLVLGLGGRFAAFALFMFNIVAVMSYPDLEAAGIRDHQIWGVMLLVLMLQGPGKLSGDYCLLRTYLPKSH